MNRFPKFIATGAFVMLSAGSALAQQTPVQGGVQVQVQTKGQPGMTYGGITQNPWFGDKAVQIQLRLSANQFTGINKGYGDALTTYNTNVNNIEKTLNEQQRAERMQEFQATFNQNVNRSVDTFISEPKQRERYRQLHLQYQGYGAFENPTLRERLNLSLEQRQLFAKYGQEWHRQMGVFHQGYQGDPQGTTDRYNELLRQNNERYNAVLNAQQQLIWRQAAGEAYNFPPSVYFQK